MIYAQQVVSAQMNLALSKSQHLENNQEHTTKLTALVQDLYKGEMFNTFAKTCTFLYFTKIEGDQKQNLFHAFSTSISKIVLDYMRDYVQARFPSLTEDDRSYIFTGLSQEINAYQKIYLWPASKETDKKIVEIGLKIKQAEIRRQQLLTLVADVKADLLQEFAHQCSLYKDKHAQEVAFWGVKLFEPQIIRATLNAMLKEIKTLIEINKEEQQFIFAQLHYILKNYCSEYKR